LAGRLGRVQDAVEMFQAIPKLEYVADLMSYNNIIWCAGNAGRIDLAKNLFQEMLKKTDLKPNIYTYGALMHGFAKTKSYRQALAYLDRMTAEGIIPNQIVFTSAMEACAEAGKYKEALAVMNKIHALGLKPDVTMINSAVKACCLAGAMDQADEIVE
jgi:leucine-rich PPR motif-containing protein